MAATSKWVRASKRSPCPVCKDTNWCSVTADGTLAKCMKVEAGSWKSKTDKNGTPYYLHRLDGAPRPDAAPPPRPPGPGAPRADADLLHRAYSDLLAGLSLSKAHREALRQRGLTEDEIDRRAYRTLPVRGRARLARDLRERFGDTLLSVPGFILKSGEDGLPYLTFAGAAGLLVPVRDLAGRVVALLSRRDDAQGGGKYSYLSSAKHGGPGFGSPPHVPLGITAPAETVRLTEGSLKADVAFALSGLPTVGAAGLGWRPALDVLGALGCKTVRLSLDADAWDNAHVARALADCSEAAAALGLAVEMERWDKSDGKGIDDLLAAGKAPEVLTGEPALAAIREAVAASTAGEPPPESGELDRLADVLAQGGIEAVYRDPKLLAALAALAENDPAEYACRRAQLQLRGAKLRDLDRALAPLRQVLRSERPPLDAAACYRVSGGRIVRDVMTQDGPIEVPLTNWSGRIVEETEHDDGAERRRTLAVEGALMDGTPLPRADVAAEQFIWMRWPVETWGTRAVVLAGASTADHVRAALQLLSGDVPRRTVYGHTGWRKIGDAWHYLHAAGAIGPNGPAAGVEVSLPDPLAGFVLPEQPAGDVLRAAVRASLGLLDGLAPDRLTFPLLAGVFRAAPGEAPGPIDFALHLAGPHGAGKSELAALAQQHFGAALDARHLPGGWSSTANALEGLAFAAKDALLAIDDYAPMRRPRGPAAARARRRSSLKSTREPERPGSNARRRHPAPDEAAARADPLDRRGRAARSIPARPNACAGGFPRRRAAALPDAAPARRRGRPVRAGSRRLRPLVCASVRRVVRPAARRAGRTPRPSANRHRVGAHPRRSCRPGAGAEAAPRLRSCRRRRHES